MTYLGWTTAQWAMAEGRYREAGNQVLAPDEQGLLALLDWWYQRGWPDPLTVRLEGVKYDYPINWAARAIRNAALNTR